MLSAGLLAATLSAAAGGGHHDNTRLLMRIEPQTRLEQVCDTEAMHRIARIRPYKPDRAKSDVISHPIHDGDFMTAEGGAFRSGGQWYALAFSCRGTPDHLRVLSLTFTIGAPIPRTRWDELDLWQ